MKRASFVKRFVALVLAMAIVLPNVNWGAMGVSAANGDEKTITAGELVAQNYELTEAEANLLESGYLVGGTYTYTLPSESGDELVEIDTDNKEIIAEKYGNWIPTKAEIFADGVSQEIVDLTKGIAYQYDGNMFSVDVTYSLNQNVPTATQKGLLEAIAYLKMSTNDIDLVRSKTNANLGVIAEAMPALKQMATGFEWAPGRKIVFDEPAKQAYEALQAQVDANNNKLALAVMNGDFVASDVATQYAVNNGEAYKAEVVNTYNLLKAIKEDSYTSNPNISQFLDVAGYSAEAVQWEAFVNILTATVNALEPVAAADWGTLDTNLFADEVNWTALDALVAAITDLSEVESYNESLLVALDKVSANASMYNVVVKAILYTAETKDSIQLTANGIAPLTLVLAENATPAQIEAAIAESGIEDDAKAEWGADYVEAGYERTATQLNSNLTQDIEYVIEYKPVDCVVTFGMGYTDVEPINVPYGYDMTLPKNEEEGKAYDYTIEEVIYAQGSVFEVKGDITINRAAGKAYNTTDLYSIIADNFGGDNGVAAAILKSGALKGNVTVSVRKPDPTDSENLLKLEDGTLTAVATYPASYNELNWTPYTYGEAGSENEFAGNTAAWAGNAAKVQYVLELTNFDVETVEEILKLASTLKADAKGYINTLQGLMENYSTIEGLDDVKLAAMSGIIGSSPLVDTNNDGVVDRNDDKSTPENIVMQQYFKAIIDDMLAKSLNTKTGKLKLYDMLTAYKAQGLKYYYVNATDVKAEIDSLSSHLTAMMDDDAKMAALEYILVAVGYADYVEELVTVEESMAQVSEDLTLPNENIILTDANALEKLMVALTANGEVVTKEAATPYLVSDVLTVLDSTMKMIQVVVDINGSTFTVTTDAMEKNAAIPADVVAKLQSDIEAEAAKRLGDRYPHYEYVVTGDDVVVGAPIVNNLNQTYTYTAKEYTVDVAGTEQTITVDKLIVALEKHASSEYTYRYTIDGQVIDAAFADTYTFTVQQLADLFANGSYTITREEINLVNDKLETTFDKINSTSDNKYEIVKDAEGNITGLNVTVVGTENGIMSFVEELVTAGYSYIALNDEPLMYKNDANELELSIQTLVNAIMADTTFGSQTLIDLGENNGGVLLRAEMQLGNSNAGTSTFSLRRSSAPIIDFEDLDFVLKLEGVPAEMKDVADGLKAVKDYMTFQSAGDHMDVDFNLPEKVYEAYLVVLLDAGILDKTDINAIDNKIAFEFFYDYIELIIENEDVTTATFEETLKKLDNASNDKIDYDLPDYDLSGYEDYYQLFRAGMMGETVSIEAKPENCTFDFTATDEGIFDVLALMGIDLSSFETYLSMIKELKDGGKVEATVVTDLKNTSRDFEAALIDVLNDEVVEKIDFTADLPTRLNEVGGAAAVTLLDTVEGTLTFNYPTILDLNGQIVNGNIVANDTLIIVDSCLSTDDAGRVNGKVSGDAIIIAGAYAYKVDAYVKDGYECVAKQIDGNTYNVVQNKLYTTSRGVNGELIIDINTGVMYENIDNYAVFAAELATDITIDISANYYNTAALYAEGKELYGYDFYDLVDLVESDSVPTELLNRVLGFVNLPDTADFINIVIEDLLDFGAIRSALINNQPVATYTFTTAPWMLEVEHIAAEDYLTIGIGPNLDLAKDLTVSLKFSGEHVDDLTQTAGWWDKVVDDDTYIRLVDVEDLTYSNQNINLTGGAKAHIHLDLSDYTTAMAIVVANGLSDDSNASADKIVAAVNNGNKAALKDEFDKLSVKDVFDAIKVLNYNESLQSLANKIGMNVTINPNEDLDTLLLDALVAAGEALEYLEITGVDATLGYLDQDDDGVYEWSAEASESGNPNYQGYGVKYNLTIARLEIVVDLFNDDCLWGDMDHDNDVDNFDATLVLQYFARLIPAEKICVEKADVNADGAIDNMDATLILQHYAKLISKFPVEE